MKLGAFDYLMKPCHMEVLMDKLKEAAAKKRKHGSQLQNVQFCSISRKAKTLTTGIYQNISRIKV
jgi:FixJ family two-component response regulator